MAAFSLGILLPLFGQGNEAPPVSVEALVQQLRGLPLDATLRVASIDWQFQPVPANAELIAAARGYAFELRMREARLAQQGFKVSLATYVELQKQYLDATEALLETRREAFAAGRQVELLTGVKLHPARAAQATPTAEANP